MSSCIHFTLHTLLGDKSLHARNAKSRGGLAGADVLVIFWNGGSNVIGLFKMGVL